MKKTYATVTDLEFLSLSSIRIVKAMGILLSKVVTCLTLGVTFLGLLTAHAESTSPTLIRFPHCHGDHIVFEAHGNLWTVLKTGGIAQRLTNDPGQDFSPRYSPDGHWIAFTGNYQGNQDVYVIPAGGGEARRLTHHSDVGAPSSAAFRGQENLVVTWTPDSRSVIFLSRRQGWNYRMYQAFEVPVSGGLPSLLPLDRSGLMTFGPDGHTIAYTPIFRDFATWKRYDGGQAQDVFTYDFNSKKLERITDWKGTDTSPMWVGHKIYFLSDRDEHRRANIWAYDLDTHATRPVTHFTDYDIDFPSYGDGEITFQQGGKLWAIDVPSENLREVKVQVKDDGKLTMPGWVTVKNLIRENDDDYDVDYSLSPNGQRAAIVGRGDIFMIPTSVGSIRNLTATSNADEDNPVWSPDGRNLAYTTDISGERQLAVRSATGGPERIITHFKSGFLYKPVWSPDGTRIAIHDGAHKLWLITLDGSEPKQVAYNRDHYMHETDEHDAAFSPDGRWLAYSLSRPTRTRALHMYEISTENDTDVSSPMESDYRPAFSPDGQLLYFVSDRHETAVMSDRETNAETLKSGGVYVTTLSLDTESPFASHSDEAGNQLKRNATESIDGGSKPKEEQRAEATPASNGLAVAQNHSHDIVLKGLMQRAVPVPIEANKIDSLDARQSRIFYQTEPPSVIEGAFPGEKSELHMYDFTTRRDEVVVEDLDSYSLSLDGSRVLFHRHGQWTVADAKAGAPSPLDLRLEEMRALIDPREEWAEMLDNSWRLERDLFVNSNMNGDDWKAVHDSYAKLLPLLGSREDLTYLIGQLIGEMGSSHTYVGGGDVGDHSEVTPTPLLGADYTLDNATGLYRISKIYAGDNTRELYRSPLTWPGVEIHEGDYLLEINGSPLLAPGDPDSMLAGLKGPVTLTVASDLRAKRRKYLVDPVASEIPVRELSWITQNRQRVDALSSGRIGYIYMSDMQGLGMQQFVRQFYPQLTKEALIVDDRWNAGGNTDQIILERLRRVLSGMQTQRDRVPQTQPDQLMVGPKVMLINQYSSSDGDVFPFNFRSYGLGKLIGMRTWGGVRGLRTRWSLLDGGYVLVPEITFYDLQGRWAAENHGVDPDIAVDDVPGEFLINRDIQLETAVKTVMDTIAKTPREKLIPPPSQPAYAPGGEAVPSFQSVPRR